MIVYKIVPESLWRACEASGQFAGSPVDASDGFIHFSSATQVCETAARHFAGVSGLLLVAIAADGLDLRWEPSRGGDLFPHLYSALPLSAVVWTAPLPLGPDGAHVFPNLEQPATRVGSSDADDRSTAEADWAARVRGVRCPLDAPRPTSNDHWDFIATLSVSSLYLARNQTYRGQCQLVFDPRHVARVDQLTIEEWRQLANDLYVAQRAVMRVVQPDHINIESLGNVVPHLHWHIIPRYQADPHWGAPIWQMPLDSMPDTRLTDDARADLLGALREAITT